jgi:hypothetical protein
MGEGENKGTDHNNSIPNKDPTSKNENWGYHEEENKDER